MADGDGLGGHELRLGEMTMKKFWIAGLLVCSICGCIEPPVPTGPAAEAPTAAIEITMDTPTTEGSTTTHQE